MNSERSWVRLLACVCFSVACNTLVFAQTQTATPSTAEAHLERVREADARCSQVPIAPVMGFDFQAFARGKNPEKIVERPVVLCAFGEVSRTWHVIQVNLEYPVPRTYYACIKTAPTLEDRARCTLPHRLVTPGYTLEHVRGSGVTRLIWNVRRELSVADHATDPDKQSEKLIVYRSRHLWFDDDALASGDVERIRDTATAVNYTPYHPDLHDAELVAKGARHLHGRVQGALRALDQGKTSGVMSRAFPERTLGNVVPWEIPMALALIEQMDDMTFRSDERRATESILIEYAINGDHAFRFSQSGANAIGPLQFTESGGNGTYSMIVRGYPELALDPVFQTGARDLANVLKAAIALIDHELASFPESLPLYKKNPKLGGAIPVAAYNGGPSWARKLFTWLNKNRIDITKEDAKIPEVLSDRRVVRCQVHCMRRDRSGNKRKVEHIVVRVHNAETPGYLVKYLSVINFLADLGLDEAQEGPAR